MRIRGERWQSSGYGTKRTPRPRSSLRARRAGRRAPACIRGAPGHVSELPRGGRVVPRDGRRARLCARDARFAGPAGTADSRRRAHRAPEGTSARSRWALPAAAVAVAAVAALAVWGISLDRSLSHEQSARQRDARILAILSDKDSQRVPISGASGTLVVSPTRNAVLVVNGLSAAPSGQTYEAWIVTSTGAHRAGLFRGGAGRKFAALTRPVPANAVVGVTLEKAGGANKPTGAMLIRAQMRSA